MENQEILFMISALNYKIKVWESFFIVHRKRLNVSPEIST